MNTSIKRLSVAIFCAIFIHALFLGWDIQQKETLPTLLPIQRIAISFGEKNIAKPEKIVLKQPPPPEKKQPEVTPTPVPKMPQKIIPLRSKHLITQKKVTQEIKTLAEATQPSVAKEERKTSDSITETAPAATRIIDEATPRYRVNPPPKYPRIAKRRGQEGVVLLEVLISITGRVNDLKIIKSSGHSLLDNAALRAVRTWSFSPGSVNGILEEMGVKVPVRFRLN